jgi:hypothetical protein
MMLYPETLGHLVCRKPSLAILGADVIFYQNFTRYSLSNNESVAFFSVSKNRAQQQMPKTILQNFPMHLFRVEVTVTKNKEKDVVIIYSTSG